MDVVQHHRRPPGVHQHLDRRARLVPLLERHIAQFDRPFSWSSHCVLFCATWVETVTGRNPMAGRPRCKTALGSARALKARGFASVCDAVSAALAEVPPSRARIGDIVARTINGEIAIGISTGRMAAFLGKENIQFLGTPGALRAWAVD